MDEREPIHVIREDDAPTQRSHTTSWLAAGLVVLVIALGLTVGYIYQQQNNTKTLASRDSEMSATIGQMQNQIDSLTSKLSQAPAAAPTQPATPSPSGATATASRRRMAAESKRLKQMQASLDDQQKQLKDTQDQLAQARSDFQSGISSARDDLNGSIARTHDELVALEQRGERNYFEFDITKAKHFQKEGPLMISLRKADAKHKRYDLAMIIDDNQLSKKSVNLYEPVWINGADREQLQLVVNKIDKDQIHGYVSAPKYSQSAGLTTVSDRTTSTASTPSSAPAVNEAGSTSDTSSTNPAPQQPQQ